MAADSFLPETFWPVFYAVTLAVAVAFAFTGTNKTARHIALVMCANWVATRYATWGFDTYEAAVTALVDLTSVIFLCVSGINRAKGAVASLFALMLVCYTMHDIGAISRNTMWAWVDVFAYLQIAIMAGIASGGHPIFSYRNRDRNRFDHRRRSVVDLAGKRDTYS